jgi:phosphorylcholine metabolism protein LicD
MVNVNILTNTIVYIVVFLFLLFIIGIGVVTKKYTGPIPAIIYGIVMFLFIIIFSIVFCNKSRKELYKPENPQLHTKLYSLMKYLHNISKQHNISYWAIAGTALGMIRNKGIIPHDDDIDIGMLKNDLDKLYSLEHILKQDGYEITHYNDVNLQHNPLGLNVYKLHKINDKNYWIDIFVYKKYNDKYIWDDETALNAWPNECYEETELFPLHTYKFGKIKIFGPRKPKKYLNRAYPGWKKIRLDFPHVDINFKKIMMLVYNRLGVFP